MKNTWNQRCCWNQQQHCSWIHEEYHRFGKNNDKVIKKYLNYKFCSNKNQLKDTFDVYYIKLLYIGNLSHHIENKISRLCKEFCYESINIQLDFTPFKIKNHFLDKDPIPDDLKPFLVYKFTCASCSSSYLSETCRHLKTMIEEDIKKYS